MDGISQRELKVNEIIREYFKEHPENLTKRIERVRYSMKKYGTPLKNLTKRIERTLVC